MRTFLATIFSLCAACFVISCSTHSPSDRSTTDDEFGEVPALWLSYAGKADMPHIVLISGDEEYRSEEALPQLAKILSTHHGFRCTVLFAQDPAAPGIVDPNYVHNIPGLDLVASADLMVLFTRFRALPDEQMQHIDDYLKAGKPVIGIRTSTHAFRFEGTDMSSSFAHYGNFYDGGDEWQDGFGRLVLGEKWISHHGHHAHQSTRGWAAPGAADHPLLNGIDHGDIWGPTDVYGVRLPLPGDSQPIVLGQVVDRAGTFDEADPLLGMAPTDKSPALPVTTTQNGQTVEVDLNVPMMPITWTKTYQIPEGKPGKAVTSTIGASVDLLEEGTRRLLVNAAFWLLELKVPLEANVDLVGTYEPSRFAFYEDEYWDKKQLTVQGLK
ncbi:MAG: hypothetical protein AAGA85_17245 [Bacteroidota bacterium]